MPSSGGVSTFPFMWPFDRKRTEPPAPPPRRVLDLEDRMERLEKAVKTLDTDWSEWYDKFRRLYARIAKRQERDEAPETPSQDAPGRTNGDSDVLGHSPLSARARAPQIHRRNY